MTGVVPSSSHLLSPVGAQEGHSISPEGTGYADSLSLEDPTPRFHTDRPLVNG